MLRAATFGNLAMGGDLLPARRRRSQVKKLNVKQILITLIVVFVVLAIWNDPSSTASTAGQFLGKVGHFLSTLIDKAATFVKGLHS